MTAYRNRKRASGESGKSLQPQTITTKLTDGEGEGSDSDREPLGGIAATVYAAFKTICFLQI